jgi:lipopolysaccharide/colanic/teichoic acid biosynthesis glycosyltransferase
MTEQALSYSNSRAEVTINESFITYRNEKLVFEFFKRIFDILLSSIGIILALPIITIFGVLIKLESSGSAIYKQKRIGLNGGPNSTLPMTVFHGMSASL